MEIHAKDALLHLASPTVGNEIRKLVRELVRLAGVRSVAPSTKIPRLLSINYGPNVIQAQTLVHYVRRGWLGARLV